MSLFTYGRAHNWFAWHPVRERDTYRLVWLRVMIRRRVFADVPGAPEWWQYQDKPKEANRGGC
ncbi:hypothetical protein [Brevibacterium moorei]|uniref:hypothetical protein n=1 Tax=Brevibacterium moorei TaxID=2968457 RepID=UPI00211BA76B|nr:hypothetical protein [Brevibacterium sp. 68QC2CO]MCQ9384399.1 hypothetical protein [Brevibacterium sp. 68QC2CO]